jgi:hypothetical protein
MAKVIPSGVLKLPNFAELDYNLKRQKTQDALKAEEFSSQFKEITGNYLAGDLEAVQSSYDAVEEARDRLATDPTNVTLIRALRTAHANHAKVAGTAQFLANNNRELKANFIANPDAYALSGTEGFRLLNLDANTPRSAEQIILAGASPIEFNPTVAKMKNYNQVAEEAYKRFLRKEDEFYDANGDLLKDKARDWFKTYMSSNFKNEKEVNNALIYEGYQQGILGDPSSASTLGYKIGDNDLTKINSKDWQEEFGLGLVNDFTTSALNQFESILPGSNISARDKRKDADARQVQQAKLFQIYKSSGGKGKNSIVGYETINLPNDKTGVLFSTAGAKVSPKVFDKTGQSYNITGFVSDGTLDSSGNLTANFVKRVYKGLDGEIESRLVRSNADDITAIKNSIGSNYYESLLKNVIQGEQISSEKTNNEDPDPNLDTSKINKTAARIEDLAKRKYSLDQSDNPNMTLGINRAIIDEMKELSESDAKLFNDAYKKIEEGLDSSKDEKELKSYNKEIEKIKSNSLKIIDNKSIKSKEKDYSDVRNLRNKYIAFIENQISEIEKIEDLDYSSKQEKIKDLYDKLKTDLNNLNSIESIDEYISSFKEGGIVSSNPLSKIVSRIKNAIYPS